MDEVDPPKSSADFQELSLSVESTPLTLTLKIFWELVHSPIRREKKAMHQFLHHSFSVLS